MELTTENTAHAKGQKVADDKADVIATIDFKMVTFSLAGKDYAIDIMRVKEIAKAGRFTYVPNTSHFVLGVYNLRGDIIPIIDLRLFFGIPVEERKGDELENMIIVSIGEQTFGVVVDAIDKVVGIQKNTIQPPHPLFGDINIKYIYGVVENAGRLYVLLDIERIFGQKIVEAAKNTESRSEADEPEIVSAVSGSQTVTRYEQPAPVARPAEKAPEPPVQTDLDFSFITNSLASLKKFNVTSVNDTWVRMRFEEWQKERGKNDMQLTDEVTADAFLAPFYSCCTGKFWTKEYADAVYAALPDNSAKQINVWNPGCGKGHETYSLACVLKKRYPASRIRIYAQDIDLLNISNAPLMAVPPEVQSSWFSNFLTKNVSGDNVFMQEISDTILFEYHDCTNSNTMSGADLIFCRDVISFLKSEQQDLLFTEFCDKLKGNGILIIGDNETINNRTEFDEKMSGSIVVLTKK